MSNDPNQTHWMHFYQLGHGPRFPPHHGSVSESTVVSTLPPSASASASASLSSSPPAAHANPSGGSTSLNPEGGVAKPARRRSRASRRTPTTVMNTDTTNFRAMVQQYTGGPPSATFGSGPGPNMLSFGFGQAQGQASALGHVQYSHQQQYNNLLSLNTTNNNNNNTSQSNQHGEGDRRLQFSLEGIEGASRGSGSGSALEAAYHHGVPPRRSSSDENVGNNDYFF